MSSSGIQSQVKAIVDKFDNSCTLGETKALMREAQTVVRGYYEEQMGAKGSALAEAAGADPQALHDTTENGFGFEIHEQPQYGSIDDYAWDMSQRYTTLEGVNLPDNAAFFDSNRKRLSRDDVEQSMASGDSHLFDISLSNEYVLLGADEKFSVREMEQRFSTNNEHLSPQSKSRKEGSTKVFKSDPRVIVIADMQENSSRGNLQVVFMDENDHARESFSLIADPEKDGEMALFKDDFEGNERSSRYRVGPEDAPHYAYALALTHFAKGFSAADDRSWFDKAQAQEVATMLGSLSETPVDANKEPVMRDILSDAKMLDGNINPVALVPKAFAAAMDAELEQGKFQSLRAEPEQTQETKPDMSFVSRYRNESPRGNEIGHG